MFMIIIDNNNYKAVSSFVIETTRAKGPSSLVLHLLACYTKINLYIDILF